ncbi:MAG: outer membrane protein assembly factor BamA, partial [Alphaproteobacteria bacterium]|nr:outer membrane protein assembly factor BamA [Alphaproteobacteria bacterium]
MSLFSKNRLAVFSALFMITGMQINGTSSSLDNPEYAFTGGNVTNQDQNIEVRGNFRIEKQSILDRIPLKLDGNYTQNDMENITKELVATGFFQYVSVTMSGTKLVISVSENPSISSIVFEGNTAVSDQELNKMMSIRPRQVLSMAEIRTTEHMIREVYKLKGMYAVSVVTQVVKESSNRVIVIFKIKEGQKAAITKVVFKGNRKISGSSLYSVISSKEKRWYYVFGDSDATYSTEKVQKDQEALRNYYRRQGYIDAVVSDVYAELAPNQTDFILTFCIQEGIRYTFGTTSVRSEKPDEVPVSCLDQDFSWKKGQWFDQMSIEGKAKQMTAQLNKKGIPFFEVVTENTVRGKCIDVQFVVRPIPPAYVGEITIQGNMKTDDEVIRRELTIKDGDPITPLALKASENRVMRLGFFDTLEITSSPNERNDRKDLLVNVKEVKSTGEMGISGGYDTQNGLVARVNLGERNFMGRGQALGLSGMISQRQKSAVLSLQTPYFMGRQLTVGGDININSIKGYTKKSFQKEGSYEQSSYGGSINASYNLSGGLIQKWTYSPNVQTIKFLSSQRSYYLYNNIKNHNTRLISTVGHQLSYNKNFYDASVLKSGYLVSTTNRFTGLGGSVHFLTNGIDNVFFYNIDQDGDYRIRLGGRYQIMSKLGYVRFSDQFNLGGFAFPGFSDSGIGPRCKISGDALGGQQMYVLSAKLDFPIVKTSNDFTLKGCFHAHYGSLWNTIFKEEEGHPINGLKFSNR